MAKYKPMNITYRDNKLHFLGWDNPTDSRQVFGSHPFYTGLVDVLQGVVEPDVYRPKFSHEARKVLSKNQMRNIVDMMKGKPIKELPDDKYERLATEMGAKFSDVDANVHLELIMQSVQTYAFGGDEEATLRTFYDFLGPEMTNESAREMMDIPNELFGCLYLVEHEELPGEENFGTCGLGDASSFIDDIVG